MNVQEEVNQEATAQEIWAQLDAEEAAQGSASVSEEQPEQSAEPAVGTSAEQSADVSSEEQAPSTERVLMDKIAGLEAMLTQVTHRLRNAEGHIGGLGSQLKQQLSTAQQVAARGGEAPSAKEIREASSDPEAMRALKSARLQV